MELASTQQFIPHEQHMLSSQVPTEHTHCPHNCPTYSQVLSSPLGTNDFNQDLCVTTGLKQSIKTWWLHN